MVEAGIARGLNVIDAFTAATGNRTLDRAHKKDLAAARKANRRYQSRLDALRFGAIAGGGVALTTGTIAILSVTPGLWLLSAGGAFLSLVSIRRWRRIGDRPVVRNLVPPATPLPRGAIGRESVKRYLNVRTQIVNMSVSISVLHQNAGSEMVNADAEAAVALLGWRHGCINNDYLARHSSRLDCRFDHRLRGRLGDRLDDNS